MNILLAIGSYVAAFVVFALIPNITQVLGLLFLRPLRRWKLLRPLAAFVFAASGVLVGFLCFAWLTTHTSLPVAIGMVVLPALFNFSNGRRRLSRAVAGVSGTRRMLEAHGEGGAYDQQSDVLTEYGYLLGDMLGYLLGIFLFVRQSPWLWP